MAKYNFDPVRGLNVVEQAVPAKLISVVFWQRGEKNYTDKIVPIMLAKQFA